MTSKYGYNNNLLTLGYILPVAITKATH